MPTNLLNRSSSLMCPHGGTVQIVSSNTRAKAGGDYIVRAGDMFTIVGCSFTLPNGTAHPCVRVDWLTHALRSEVGGDTPLTQSSTGLCLAGDEAPQGSVIISAVQARVRGD